MGKMDKLRQSSIINDHTNGYFMAIKATWINAYTKK